MPPMNFNEKKNYLKSKTLWINILSLVAGVVLIVQGNLESGIPLTIMGVANKVLRLYTSKELTWKS